MTYIVILWNRTHDQCSFYDGSQGKATIEDIKVDV
jgi:hypothetical protein